MPDEINLGSENQTSVPYVRPLESVVLEPRAEEGHFSTHYPMFPQAFFLVGVKDKGSFQKTRLRP